MLIYYNTDRPTFGGKESISHHAVYEAVTAALRATPLMTEPETKNLRYVSSEISVPPSHFEGAVSQQGIAGPVFQSMSKWVQDHTAFQKRKLSLDRESKQWGDQIDSILNQRAKGQAVNPHLGMFFLDETIDFATWATFYGHYGHAVGLLQKIQKLVGSASPEFTTPAGRSKIGIDRLSHDTTLFGNLPEAEAREHYEPATGTLRHLYLARLHLNLAQKSLATNISAEGFIRTLSYALYHYELYLCTALALPETRDQHTHERAQLFLLSLKKFLTNNFFPLLGNGAKDIRQKITQSIDWYEQKKPHTLSDEETEPWIKKMQSLPFGMEVSQLMRIRSATNKSLLAASLKLGGFDDLNQLAQTGKLTMISLREVVPEPVRVPDLDNLPKVKNRPHPYMSRFMGTRAQYNHSKILTTRT